MMYSIKVETDGKAYPLYLPGDDALIVLDPVLTMEMGMQGSLVFSVPRRHPYHDKVRMLSSEIYVFQDGEEIFRGRPVGRQEDFCLTGKVTCEGDLAYLLDSQQRPYEHKGGIEEFLRARLAAHNSSVEARKRFGIGKVTVADSNNYINRSSTGYSDTLSCLREKLVKTHGGYLRTRLEGSSRYLDYVNDYGGINKQAIRFGENLLDMAQYMDSSEIITALIPVGAEAGYVAGNGITIAETVDIRPVNGGSDFIYDQDAVERYGWIFGVVHWEDVTLPENLLKKARAYLEEAVNLPLAMELKAVDLSMVDVDIDRMELGYWTKVVSGPHNVEGTYLLTKKTLHLADPGKDTVTLGGAVASFSASSAKSKMDISARVQQVALHASREISQKVENATQLITGGLGGYVVIGQSEDGHPEEILVMDAPAKEAAKNLIRINKNGLGFSTSGYNGPYKNAWTIDGNLVADFITAGTMLADRIRGGRLEVGGTGLGKDGVISIMDVAGNEICRIDNEGMQFFDKKNNSSAVFNRDGVRFFGNNSILAEFNADGVQFYGNNSNNILAKFSQDGVKFYDIREKDHTLAEINTDGVQFYGNNSNNILAKFSQDGVKFYDSMKKDRILAEFNADGVQFYGNNSNNILAKFSQDGVQFYDGEKKVIAEFNADGINLTKGNISGVGITGSSFRSAAVNGNYIELKNGKLSGGMNDQEAGTIDCASTLNGQMGLQFRGYSFVIAAGIIGVSQGKDDRNLVEAKTGRQSFLSEIDFEFERKTLSDGTSVLTGVRVSKTTRQIQAINGFVVAM